MPQFDTSLKLLFQRLASTLLREIAGANDIARRAVAAGRLSDLRQLDGVFGSLRLD